jgi:hypothetical protein
MKLIEKNSPLKCLPQSISLKEIMVFDGIRFTCEMIDSIYPVFLEKILEITQHKPDKNLPSIFQDCWAIIDNAARVEKICRKLLWEKPEEILSDFTNLRLFRNTYQHLEDRIDTTIDITKMPLYGVISWIHKIPNQDKFEMYQIVSGNSLGQIGNFAKQTVGEYNNESPEINDLRLHTLDDKGNAIDINIENLCLDLKKLISEMERRFYENQSHHNWEFPDWKLRQDIVLRIVNPD